MKTPFISFIGTFILIDNIHFERGHEIEHQNVGSDLPTACANENPHFVFKKSGFTKNVQ